MLPLFLLKQIAITLLLNYMKILTTSTGTQRLRFIPRTTGQAVNVKLTDKNTRVTTTTPSFMVYDDGYSYIDISLTLKEGTMYDLEIEMITQVHIDSVKDNDIDGIYKLYNTVDKDKPSSLTEYDVFYRKNGSNEYLTYSISAGVWLMIDNIDSDPTAYSSSTSSLDVTNLPSSVTWQTLVGSEYEADTLTFTLVEKEVIYRDTVFCTDQTDYRKYTVNQGEYTTENTYDNDFIVL